MRKPTARQHKASQHKAYTKMVKPGDKGTKTFSPSADLKKLVDNYIADIQKAIDGGTDTDTAFKTKPDLDDLTIDDLLEILLHNKTVGEGPIKELNYLDLYSILQHLLEQKVWQLAVQWWGQQETKVQQDKEKDTTETVVLKKPKAAKLMRRRKLGGLSEDVKPLGIEFASGQEPESNEDFATTVTLRFSVSGQTLARLLRKQRRVLSRYLENVSQRQLLSALLNSDEVLSALKPFVKRFIAEDFVYELDLDPPRRMNIDWAEESDYPYSAKTNPIKEEVIYEAEIDVWD